MQERSGHLCGYAAHWNIHKFKAPKVWTDKNRAIIAGACNDDNYLQMTVDEVVDNLEDLTVWTHKSIKKAISDALTKVHKAIRIAFEPTDVNRPLVYLMIGARLDDWKATLIKTLSDHLKSGHT